MKRSSASVSPEMTRPARKDWAGSDDSRAAPAGDGAAWLSSSYISLVCWNTRLGILGDRRDCGDVLEISSAFASMSPLNVVIGVVNAYD